MVLLSFLFVLMSVELFFLRRMYQYSLPQNMLFSLRNNLARLSPLYPLDQAMACLSATFMATKRKREDNSEVNSPDGLWKLLSAITSDASAKVALLQIMEEYDLRPSLLQQILTRSFILFGLSEAN